MKSTIATLSRLLPTVLLGLSCAPFLFASEISTTRLKSTAGTGVGALLVDEATVLNPASISFFQVSSIYVQKAGSDITPDADSPLSSSSEENMLFIASDSKGEVDGSISYSKEDDRYGKVSRLAASASSSVGERSALGFSYSTTKREGNGPLPKKIKQIAAGVTHAITPEFTFGIVVPDILGEDPLARRAIIGGQYVYKDFIALMFDAGAGWETDAKESSLVRAAIQLKVFQDFYMRFGAQEDKGLKKKGTGAGIGWVQPRLVIEAAVATTKFSELAAIGQNAEEAKETSFSLSYRF
tara:strand:- start:633 stop:1523 length:891 start_codon:yes stop_codon:yes gene_type:complete